MQIPTPELVRAAIEAAPAFARLGLSVRDPRLRARAAGALAEAIVEGLDRPPPVDPGQLALPL